MIWYLGFWLRSFRRPGAGLVSFGDLDFGVVGLREDFDLVVEEKEGE